MKTFLLIPIFLTSMALSSCAPLLVGGVSGTGYTVVQERSVGNFVDDSAIWAQISSNFVQEDVDSLFGNIEVKVNEGRVLLTGQVQDIQTRIEAVRLAWQPNGVREVINEIQVTDKKGVRDYAQDAWITTQARSKLLLNRDIRSINYSIETVNGVVYLLGIAQNEGELDEVTHIAGTVKGVQKVISHVRMKDDPLRR